MVKRLLLFFIFLITTTRLFACDIYTVAYYKLNNDFTNNCGGNIGSLVQNGTVGFVTSPTPPSGNTYWAGPFSSTNYLSGSTNLVNSLNNASVGTVEFYINLNNISNNPVIISVNNSNVWMQVAYNGQVNFGTTNGNNISTVSGLITTGVTYDIAFTWDGTNKNIYINNVKQATVANGGTPFSNINAIYVGTYFDHSLPVIGYIGQLRFSNIARTSFPTIDPTLLSFNQPVYRNQQQPVPQNFLQKIWNNFQSIIYQNEDQPINQ